MDQQIPEGVMSLFIWEYATPDPMLDELADRYENVLNAVGRYREVGIEPPREWLAELGVPINNWRMCSC